MNKEVVFVLEPDVGRVTVEISRVTRQAIDDLAGDLGNRVDLNCAKPAKKDRYLPVLQPDSPLPNKLDADSFSIWLYRLYHNSVVDGPGRRSVIQTAGCSVLCSGCHIPQAQKRENRSLVPLSPIVKEILDHRAEHDGVTILGGEPFDQPDSLPNSYQD